MCFHLIPPLFYKGYEVTYDNIGGTRVTYKSSREDISEDKLKLGKT